MSATESDGGTIALIGNPNTGKSTLFGALSGLRQRVGNYPGVTVEKAVGQFPHVGRRWMLVDLPGTYSLAPRSPDEMVAVDVLLGRRADVPAPDVVLCVVAADNLEQNLYLLSQVRELGRPIVVALTMLDVAGSRGLSVNVDLLRQRLGVPVVAVQAHRRRGLAALKDALAAAVHRPPPALESPFPAPFCAEVDRLEAELEARRSEARALPRYLIERLLLDANGYIEGHLPLNGDRDWLRQQVRDGRQRLEEADCPVPAVEISARYGWVATVVEGVIERPPRPPTTLGDRIDAVLTQRLWGTLVLALVLLLVFTAVFSWAKAPMGWIEAGVAALSGLIQAHLTPGPLRSLVVEGVLGGLGAVVIFLPQIFILFFFLATLEECGYLARAAYLMDKVMVRVGLSGKSFIPLLSSFACAIPGVMAARIIENRRDRLTTVLIAPLMSCSARLPIYTLMIAAFVPDRHYLGGLLTLPGLTLMSMYVLGIVTAAGVALILRRTLLRGTAPPFFMELPAYKWPTPGVVLHRVLERGWDFIRNAGTLIFAVSIVMWAALYYPRVSPLVVAPLRLSKSSWKPRGMPPRPAAMPPAPRRSTWPWSTWTTGSTASRSVRAFWDAPGD